MTTEYMICVDCSGTGVIQGVRCPACNGAGKAITVMSSKPYKKLTSDGSTASYYELPEGATELQHLISYKNMNGQVAEAFRSLYRFGESSHSSRIRDAKKVIFYMQAEIERIKNMRKLTMANSLSVLDHGFVTLLNLSGPTRRTTADTCTDFEEGKKASIGARSFDADDVDPAQSARMSFNQRDPNRERSSDLRLNSYLMKHHHTTPIEMIETWWEMKLPIFVARQFVRHRTVSINEVSARYTTLPEEWYIPEPANVGVKSASNKQGRTLCIDGVDWDTAKAELFCRELNVTCKDAYAKYKWALENNIPPEVARSFLHVNHYTHWLWKQNLHNLFHFLALRDHSHAQWESQQYAKAMIEILRQHLPNLMNLYDEYRRLP